MKESTKPLIQFLEQFPHLSQVRKIISDNGPAFVSKEFISWCDKHNIQKINTAPYNPQANGMAERRIRDIKMFLTLYPNQVGGWKETLQKAHLNRSYHSTIGCSPHFKAFGTTDPFPADKIFNV